MRMRLRAPGHEGRPGDELYTLLPDEVPLRLAVSVFVCGGGGRGGLSGCVGCAVWWRCCCCCGFPPTAPTHPHLQDLGNERAAADADLRERLGTLRYLLGLQEREASKAAAAAAAAAAAEAAEAGAAAPVQEAPQVGAAAADAALAAGVEPEAMEVDRASTAAGEAGEDDMCPICHEELGAELVRRRAGGGGAAGADEARGGLGKPHTPPLAPPSGHAGLRAPPLLPLQHGPGGASATQPGAGKRTHERAIGGGGGGARPPLPAAAPDATHPASTHPTHPAPPARAGAPPRAVPHLPPAHAGGRHCVHRRAGGRCAPGRHRHAGILGRSCSSCCCWCCCCRCFGPVAAPTSPPPTRLSTNVTTGAGGQGSGRHRGRRGWRVCWGGGHRSERQLQHQGERGGGGVGGGALVLCFLPACPPWVAASHPR